MRKAVIVLAGVGANAAAVLVIWLALPGSSTDVEAPPAPPALGNNVVAEAQPVPAPRPQSGSEDLVVTERTITTLALRAAVQEAALPDLVLTAARGDCWLEVRVGSSTGKVLFFGTLARGASQPFRRDRLWIAVGAGANLDVTLNGRPVEGFPRGTAAVTVTAAGVRATAA